MYSSYRYPSQIISNTVWLYIPFIVNELEQETGMFLT
jgi:hypothetical protein